VEDIWLAWAKRLQSLASTGLHFGAGPFDRERYAEIASIANGMLAALGNVPIARIEGLVPDFGQGYATPRIDVRGAVIENDSVLLVRERGDGLWTLPGGYADVGLSPAENVAKEIWEEATLRVTVRGLYGLRHKAKHDYVPDVRDFYKLFFLCERVDDAKPMPGTETSEVGFFRLDALPQLSRGKVIERDIAAAFEFQRGAAPVTVFD
jgi:ADP-ribose pyrophosphatase YjhB (NUDIX family)